MAELITNKDAFYRFIILETFEAGLVLSGPEVKSLKNKHGNLKGSYISFKNGEAYLVNAHISKYKPAGHQVDYNPERPRKLLLNKKEIKYLLGKSAQKGLTIIPIKVYTKRDFLKVTIVIARGKKIHDKRASIKEKELQRRLKKVTKEQYRL